MVDGLAEGGQHGARRRLHDGRLGVIAGEALDGRVLERWRMVTGLSNRDGYGWTETGQLTGERGAGRRLRRC